MSLNVIILARRDETMQALHAELAGSSGSSVVEKGVESAVFTDAASAKAADAVHCCDLIFAETDLPGTEELVRDILCDRPEMPLGLILPEGGQNDSNDHFEQKNVKYFVSPINQEELAAFIETFNTPSASGVVATINGGSGEAHAIAGASDAFVQVVEHARRIASTSVPVLITGESGTGKELISRLIHCHSARKENSLVTVNCAALSDSLLESELFGHEQGAFTGASRRHAGHFEQAHGGTIILDEISETSRKLQAELLRVLEQQEFKRLGGTEDIRINVRVVATTNRDLAKMVRKGGFRKDLFYRLGVVRLNVPPLRNRPEDIPVLVWHFVNMYSAEAGRSICHLDDEMMEMFERHDWPGNVRQLRNVVRSAMLFGSGPVLSLEHTPLIRSELMQTENEPDSSTLHLKELERQAILEALRRTRRNQAKAARLLGITDRTLREKLRKYNRSGRLSEELASGENK